MHTNSFCCGFCLAGSHCASLFGLELTLYTRLTLSLHPLLPLECWDYGEHHHTFFHQGVQSQQQPIEPGHITKEKEKREMSLGKRAGAGMNEASGFSQYCKENKHREGEIAHLVKCLPFKHRYLCSSPSTHRKARYDADNHGLMQEYNILKLFHKQARKPTPNCLTI